MHRLNLAAGHLLFEQEDIGPPALARDFLLSLGAAEDDACVVDAPGRRWQVRVDDLALIADPLDALARAA